MLVDGAAGAGAGRAEAGHRFLGLLAHEGVALPPQQRLQRVQRRRVGDLPQGLRGDGPHGLVGIVQGPGQRRHRAGVAQAAEHQRRLHANLVVGIIQQRPAQLVDLAGRCGGDGHRPGGGQQDQGRRQEGAPDQPRDLPGQPRAHHARPVRPVPWTELDSGPS